MTHLLTQTSKHLHKAVFFTVLMMFLCSLFVAGNAYSQEADDLDQMSISSEISIPEAQQLEQFPKLNFGQDNKYFTNITTLQYQNSLLEILMERQQKTKEIADSFKSIGLPFRQPPPPRNVCAELPKNQLCQSFYSDLYGAKKIVPRKDKPRQTTSSSVDENTPVKKAVKKTKAPKKAPYRWADISCVAGDCRAVLVGFGKDAQIGRSSVKVGTQLKDGWRVGEIGFNRISLIKGSQIETLKPLPSSLNGGSSSPFFGGASIEVLQNDGQSDASQDSMSSFDPNEFQTEINVEELLSELEQDVDLGEDIQIIE